MRQPEPHFIKDEIADEWLEDFAAEGVEALEGLLEKHARFLAFLKKAGRL